MHAFVLSELTTIRGHAQSAGTLLVTQQSEHDLLDLAGYLDAVFWIDVKSVTLGGASAVNVNLVTQPTTDNSLVRQMASVSVTGPGVTVVPVLFDFATVALARYARWAVTPASYPTAGPWDVTFRALCCANPAGKGMHLPRGNHPAARKLAPPATPPSKRLP